MRSCRYGKTLFVKLDAMLLQPPQQLRRILGAVRAAVGLEPHVHDAIEHQGEEANQPVCADAPGQPVRHLRDADVIS